MRKKLCAHLFFGILFILSISHLYAQSNETLDRFLAQERAVLGYSAYMVLTAADELPEESSPQEAAMAVSRIGWMDTSTASNDPISLGEYSYLLMKAFDIRGGLMYTLFPGPRYAARELKYLQCIPGKSTPGRSISGTDAVQILGRVLEWKEDRS
ncbi:MAG: hypothetical protein K9L66_07500 [Spirochaetaceae bacterium]|nr:hypothetical protein [Spirochaetaceae bacterium]MCF7949513.1 hypothetical protein [Spirochaetia bacterium]MCF7951337.1 hypothetical protein [Spirochaetaceae bacterium]